MSRLLKRDVDRLHDEWAREASWRHENDCGLWTYVARYRDAQKAYEAQTGREYKR